MSSTWIAVALTALVGSAAFAADKPKPKATPAAKAAPAKAGGKAPAAKDAATGPRKKQLDFEERVIEGLSNKGYESLSQTGTLDSGGRDKLYRKRAEFDDDSKYLLREMEFLK